MLGIALSILAIVTSSRISSRIGRSSAGIIIAAAVIFS